ncbi:MAG: biotin--acetyl-CoA-carboxylase ligase [Marmoricola sp.]|nr:biotin--acetyl-CoA-carboxylase ligase [Marmoricola sp.]
MPVLTPEPHRSPLELDALVAAAGPRWSVQLHADAGSTNALAAADPVADTLVVADHQTAGRGRLDRTWDTPRGSALTLSAVVDPGIADQDWPLLPLAAALAVADGVRRAAGVTVAVKWPNDLLVGTGKVAGILLERVHPPGGRPLAVIGIGINVGLGVADLPVPTASSLAIAGSDVDRLAVFAAVVPALAAILEALRAEPAAVLERYRSECDTVGREVDVHLPGGEILRGTATGIDRTGRLLVGERAIGAGDIVHVRPT